MSSKTSDVQAPKPIGVMDDAVARLATTPALPPTSPKKAATPSQRSRRGQDSNGNITLPTQQQQQQQQQCSSADYVSPLPAIVSVTSNEERYVPRTQGQRWQRRTNAERSSLLVNETPAGNFGDATPSLMLPSHRTTQDVTVPPTMTMTAPAAQHVVAVQEYGVLEDFTTATTIAASGSAHPSQLSPPTPTSVAKRGLARKPPTMNPNLFTSSSAETPLSSFNGRPADFNASGGIAGYSSATSSAGPASSTVVTSAPTTPVELSRTNLIVYNIGPEMTEEALHELFGIYGEVVSCAVMREIHTSCSLGTAFVRFATNAEARRALYALNDRTKPLFFCDTKPLVVQWAHKQHDDAPIGDARKKIMKLFVRNIPLDCSVEALEALFSQYGGVRQVTLHKDTASVEDAAMERLIAFVIFTEEGAAERAATAVHNTKPFASCCGIPIMIKLAQSSQRRRFCRNADGTTTSAANSPMAGRGGGFTTSQVICTGGSFGHPVTNTATSTSLYSTPGPQLSYVSVTTTAAPAAAAAAAQGAPTQPYEMNRLQDNYLFSSEARLTESSSMCAQTNVTVDGLTADDHGLNGPHMIHHMIHGNHTNANNSSSSVNQYQQAPCGGGAGAAGMRRSASYTQFSQRSAFAQQRYLYDYEDVGSADSLTRMNTYSSGGGGANSGGNGFTVSPKHSRNHTANSLEASLTSHGTDRASTSSRSAGNGVENAMKAASSGLRETSSRSWLSANDSSANTSAHGTLVNSSNGSYQLTTLGIQAGCNGHANGHLGNMCATESGAEEASQPPQGGPSSFYSTPTVTIRTRASVPAAAVLSSVTNGGNGTAEKNTSMQYLLYPGKTHHSSSVSPASVLNYGGGGSNSGNTLRAISNDNSNGSSSTTLPSGAEPTLVTASVDTAVEASEAWRRVVRTHTQYRRVAEAEANEFVRQGSSSAVLRSTPMDPLQPQQQTVLMFASAVHAADAIEVIPKASPPKLPSTGVNPRLAAASVKPDGDTCLPAGSNEVKSNNNSSCDVSGGREHGGGSDIVTTTSSTSARKRYYNNPYCPDSPKLYC